MTPASYDKDLREMYERKIAELQDELRQHIKCADVSNSGKRERIVLLEYVLYELLYCDSEDLMRCRNNAKIALGHAAIPTTHTWKKEKK